MSIWILFYLMSLTLCWIVCRTNVAQHEKIFKNTWHKIKVRPMCMHNPFVLFIFKSDVFECKMCELYIVKFHIISRLVLCSYCSNVKNILVNIGWKISSKIKRKWIASSSMRRFLGKSAKHSFHLSFSGLDCFFFCLVLFFEEYDDF